MSEEKEQVITATQEQLEAELNKAFHLLCDAFPEPMQLCYRTHRVVAVNPAAETHGRHVGDNCARNCPGLKAGLCRHAQMMKSGNATWFRQPDGSDGAKVTAYWIPINGHPDYYLHFGVGVTIDYSKYPNEEQHQG